MTEVDYKHRLDKVMTEEEVIETFLKDGGSFSTGGFIARRPWSVTREIVRQRKKDLTFINFGSTFDTQMLVGAGCIRKLETSYFLMRTGGMAMDETVMLAIKEGIPNPIEIEDYSHYTMLARFMAGGMGIPYMPVRSSLGTDIPKYNNRIKIVNDPFENKPLLLAPAARTDVCFISAHRADRRGNAQIFGAQWPDDAMCRACEHLVVITEELVPPEVIQKYPTNTLMPCYSVDAVVELPFNCHPLACYGCYAQDTPCFLGLALSFRTRDGVLKWLDEWVYGTKDHFEYCDKVGWRNLMRLAKMEKSINRIPE